MDLVTPEFGLIFWTLITFLALLFILKKFAWKPILGAVDYWFLLEYNDFNTGEPKQLRAHFTLKR